ncbi:MAG TPA: glucose-6-phosphate isomerase, partial [Spartobacteria bacterium]|nr:glucose-6-phosphate isomerase [Spartobacteria bacterium]
PNAKLRADIEETNARIKKFAADVHAGKIAAEDGKRFQHILLIGIGGSALGSQFIADALGSTRDPMDIYFFDNTDPDGFDRVFAKIDKQLS